MVNNRRNGWLNATVLLLLVFWSQLACAQAASGSETPTQSILQVLFFDDYGREVRLDNLGEGVRLVHVWATWCSPCRQEIPSLERLRRETHFEHFHIIPIAIDPEGPRVVQRFANELALENFRSYYDPQSRLAKALRVTVIPSTIVVDHAGQEVHRFYGAVDWDSQEIRSFLKKQLQRFSQTR